MSNELYRSVIEQIPAQTGKFAVITGTGGLGLETAKALAQLGAQVVVAGRNPAKGEDATTEIRRVAPRATLSFELLDLADLRSINDFGERMVVRGTPIDILVNNAGIMSPPQRRETHDGFEAQFGTNHLGHFALTAKLLPLLCQAELSRVIHVTSLAHRYAQIDFADIQNETMYRPGVAYCQSKLAVALFARAMQRRAEAAGWPIASIAVHPGFAGTNLIAAEQGANSFMDFLSRKFILPLFGQSAANGALPLTYAAVSSEIKGGELYGPTGFMELKGRPGICAFASSVLDVDVGDRLWQISEQLTGTCFANPT